MDFELEFKKQLGFIQSSFKSYRAGDYDEAARLATTLRVMFHHTDRSRSLIDYLGWWDRKIISTVADMSGCVTQGLVFSLPIHYENGMPKTFEEYSISEWWNQEIVLKEDIRPTRGQIIKWTANKDGGTHYDPKQPASYLHAKKMLKFKHIADDSDKDSFAQRLVGHFSYEVLQSFIGPDAFL